MEWYFHSFWPKFTPPPTTNRNKIIISCKNKSQYSIHRSSCGGARVSAPLTVTVDQLSTNLFSLSVWCTTESSLVYVKFHR